MNMQSHVGSSHSMLSSRVGRQNCWGRLALLRRLLSGHERLSNISENIAIRHRFCSPQVIPLNLLIQFIFPKRTLMILFAYELSTSSVYTPGSSYKCMLKTPLITVYIYCRTSCCEDYPVSYILFHIFTNIHSTSFPIPIIMNLSILFLFWSQL